MKEAQKRNRYFLYKQSSPVHSFILLYIIRSIILHPFSTHLSFIHHPLHPSSKLSSMINLLYIIPFLNVHFKTRNNFADFSSVGSNYFQIFFLSIYLSGKEASLITLELLYFLCYYHLSISYIYIFIYPSYIYIFIYLSYIYIFIYLSYIFIFIYLSIHFLLCHLFNQVCLLSMLWQPRIPSRSANHH